MKKSIIFIGLIILSLWVLTHRTTVKRPASKPAFNRHIEIGAWTEGLFDPSGGKLHSEKLSAFEKLTGKKLAIAHYYLGWEALSDPAVVEQFALLRQHGWQPMLNVNPYFFEGCPPAQLPLYKAIAAGECDGFLHKAGKNLSSVRQPFYLLFAWEMNNGNNPWSIKYSGSSAADFVAAWRHIRSIFKQENVTGAIWVFCPNVPDDPEIPYDRIYPGDAFVDWISLDGYNWGNSQPWSSWTSFADVFRGSYEKMTSLAPRKPLMIAEVNSANAGGDKGAWLTDMLTVQIPYHFPKIDAVVIFNEDRTKQENVDWRIDTDKTALKAYAAAVHSKFY